MGLFILLVTALNKTKIFLKKSYNRAQVNRTKNLSEVALTKSGIWTRDFWCRDRDFTNTLRVLVYSKVK